MKLVECVPNFSEGRDPVVIDAICAEIEAVPGITLIGREMDADHNRAVVTFVGGLEAAQEAAFRAIQCAARLIDLNGHEGAHPRMGATDVCPFVPIGDTTMAEAVEAARSLAARVGEQLQIPVFLYEDAARRPERKSLPMIRKGGFEALRDLIGTDPEKEPDHGPPKIHPTAGATAIGARFFLIAYNVNLATDDVDLAKRIASEIREKGGGMPAVKAMGFHLADRDIAQVSMNLVDYRKTSPGQAFEEIRRRAQKEGVSVLESEVVGLIPQDAVTRSFVDLTRAADWTGEEILEGHLPSAPYASPSPAPAPRVEEPPPTTGSMAHPLLVCAPFLEMLSSATPTPGGGSAAALCGATAAALVMMVCELTRGKKGYDDVQDDVIETSAQAQSLRDELHALVKIDAEAYDRYMDAIRLPKGTDEEKAARRQAMAVAAIHAAKIPLVTMRKSLEVMELASSVARKGNKNAVSDVVVGALLARAAIRAADQNVRINLPTVKDLETRGRLSSHANELLRKAEELEKRTLRAAEISRDDDSQP